MPASNKMLKRREHANNKKNGIGDKDGKIPARTKAEETSAKCTICAKELRITKTNIELRAHADGKHPKNSYAECFPGQH